MADLLFNTSNLLQVLEDLAKDVRKNYKEHLWLHKHVASGDLMRSISTEVVVSGTTYEVVMNLADYWQYVEEDTKPHWPPKAAIDRWIFIKPLLPRPMTIKRVWWTNGRQPGKEKTIYNEKYVDVIPSGNSLSYLIRRKIATEGTKGTHDLRDTERAVLPMYEERLKEALERDTIEYIQKVLP